ncbi:hypothetical protein HMPREF9430_01637 [Solobacterium moorei F0204]|uniref:Uncharacterized protein n=1 Tax=Solobacterium moorei F0204 TaxID=706433 RepID=E7MPR3_9FIRM|nr:hypothetical protein HMPREF9430_01637 [Solobacterium moorei F0204]
MKNGKKEHRFSPDILRIWVYAEMIKTIILAGAIFVPAFKFIGGLLG